MPGSLVEDGWWDYAAKLPEVDATASSLCQNAPWPVELRSASKGMFIGP